ncbi:MAG: hypothetical protein ACK5NG_03420 [Chthoniobacterales bacterium]
MPEKSSLPYHDSKPKGAADFYFGINATFRFVQQKLGHEGLIRYWQQLGSSYYKPVTEIWSRGGLPAVAQYWKDFFQAEPLPDENEDEATEVKLSDQEVEIQVKKCPAIAHLQNNNRTIHSTFCQHCYYVSEAMAAPAGLSVRIEGGAGSCRQHFFKKNPDTPPQDLTLINTCS